MNRIAIAAVGLTALLQGFAMAADTETGPQALRSRNLRAWKHLWSPDRVFRAPP